MPVCKHSQSQRFDVTGCEGLAYSSTGFTNALHAEFLSLSLVVFMLHLRKPRVLFIVSLAADIDDIGVPTDFKGDLNSKVFCPHFCAKSVIVELVL